MGQGICAHSKGQKEHVTSQFKNSSGYTVTMAIRYSMTKQRILYHNLNALFHLVKIEINRHLVARNTRLTFWKLD